MNIKRIFKIIAYYIWITICFLSLFLGLFYTYLLDIEKVILKEGIFELINRTYEFDIKGATNDKYYIFLRFYRQKDIVFYGLSEGKIKYSIDLELTDENNNLIKIEAIDETSLRSGRIAQDYFEWRLLSFDSEKGKKYKFKMTFKNNDIRFDQVKKEIYIEEDYDYAALPWWALFRLIFLSIFIVTFIPLLIIVILLVRKRRARSN